MYGHPPGVTALQKQSSTQTSHPEVCISEVVKLRNADNTTDLVNVLVDVAVEPVVHHNVPRAVVVGERRGVPPVLVEEAVAKAKHLGKGVQPGMKNGKKACKKK